MTSENSDIVDNVKEYAKLVENKYLPTVKAWLEILTKTSGEIVTFMLWLRNGITFLVIIILILWVILV